jgi:DNA-binding LytR/AlgR family response regulator
MLRVAIIEDEKLTANDLAETLKKIDSDIEVVAILATIEQSVSFLKMEPTLDLIFSDIQLPDGLSFEIFNRIRTNVPIIFCTAFDQYALDAFNTNGIDYLLKPFSKATVAKALGKYQSLKEKFAFPNSDLYKFLQLFAPQQVQKTNTSILIRHGDKITPLELQQIALFFLEDQYAFAITFETKKHLVSQNLEELETICGALFFRANRQYLVNRKAIKDASQYFNRKLLVNLNIVYKEQITVGKLKTTLFLEWLANQ